MTTELSFENFLSAWRQGRALHSKQSPSPSQKTALSFIYIVNLEVNGLLRIAQQNRALQILKRMLYPLFFGFLYMLQCVAVCCSVLQCVAVCCIVLQCSVLQCVAVCCNVLQSNSQKNALSIVFWFFIWQIYIQCVTVCCSVLQRVAVCCSVLQCVAVCCSVLQCAAVCALSIFFGFLYGKFFIRQI